MEYCEFADAQRAVEEQFECGEAGGGVLALTADPAAAGARDVQRFGGTGVAADCDDLAVDPVDIGAGDQVIADRL
ncbi:hypothetical protein GCM10009554_79040 [Kribbella koreensis]|uniref:Uncharacterized protein n=1 Tax=Kribbella koreensis TaxID=57909 RepID=A0ABP4C8R7_9ACTN